MPGLKNRVMIVAIGLLFGNAAHGQTGMVVGSVYAPGSNGTPVPIPGVRVTLGCTGERASITATNAQGQFSLTNVPAGNCALSTDVQGFTAVIVALERTTADRIDVPISLEPAVLYSGLLVTGIPPNVMMQSVRSSANGSGNASAPRRTTCESLRQRHAVDHVDGPRVLRRHDIARFEPDGFAASPRR